MAAPAPTAEPDYNVSDEDTPENIKKLLRIVNEGISDIIKNIKKEFGTTIQETNTNAKNIIDLLEGISNSIFKSSDGSGSISTILQDDDYKILNRDDTTGNYSTSYKDNNNEKYYIINNTKDQIKDTRKFSSNLDVSSTITINDTILDLTRAGHDGELDLNDENNITKIQNRLINCQNLEFLYLVKHEELMRTFAFTLNLFDKYKYAIKILLYVIKNLVYKGVKCPSSAPGTSVEPPKKIKLPKTIIKNMAKLLADQEEVQKTITKMEEGINDNNLNKMLAEVKNKERDINENIENTDSPPNSPGESTAG